MKEQYNFDNFMNRSDNCFSSRNNNMDMTFMDTFMPNAMISQNLSMSGQNNINLAKPYDGFIQGNLFNNLYDGYKNYRPMRLMPNNEQAELLLKVNQYSFAQHELRLYLDVFPNDVSIINLFNEYRSMANQAIFEYQQKYGPLTWEALSSENNFSWESTAWPWEMGVR